MTQEVKVDVPNDQPEMVDQELSASPEINNDEQKPLYNKRQVSDVVNRERD